MAVVSSFASGIINPPTASVQVVLAINNVQPIPYTPPLGASVQAAPKPTTLLSPARTTGSPV